MGQATGQKGRILVVEDDHDLCDAVLQTLELEGYEAVPASNGLEALAILRTDAHFGLILLDLMMPLMDGAAFLAEVKQDSHLAHIPVVVLSADRNIQRKAEQMPAASFLCKPVRVSELMTVVEHYCSPTVSKR